MSGHVYKHLRVRKSRGFSLRTLLCADVIFDERKRKGTSTQKRSKEIRSYAVRCSTHLFTLTRFSRVWVGLPGPRSELRPSMAEPREEVASRLPVLKLVVADPNTVAELRVKTPEVSVGPELVKDTRAERAAPLSDNQS